MKNPSTALIDNCLQPSTQRTHVSSDSISSTSSQNSTACESLYTTVSVNSLVTSASDRSITSKLSTTAPTAMTTPEPPKNLANTSNSLLAFDPNHSKDGTRSTTTRNSTGSMYAYPKRYSTSSVESDQERINILRDEIARKSASIKHLEQLAQELPQLASTRNPNLSRSLISRTRPVSAYSSFGSWSAISSPVGPSNLSRSLSLNCPVIIPSSTTSSPLPSPHATSFQKRPFSYVGPSSSGNFLFNENYIQEEETSSISPPTLHHAAHRSSSLKTESLPNTSNNSTSSVPQSPSSSNAADQQTLRARPSYINCSTSADLGDDQEPNTESEVWTPSCGTHSTELKSPNNNHLTPTSSSTTTSTLLTPSLKPNFKQELSQEIKLSLDFEKDTVDCNSDIPATDSTHHNSSSSATNSNTLEMLPASQAVSSAKLRTDSGLKPNLHLSINNHQAQTSENTPRSTPINDNSSLSSVSSYTSPTSGQTNLNNTCSYTTASATIAHPQTHALNYSSFEPLLLQESAPITVSTQTPRPTSTREPTTITSSAPLQESVYLHMNTPTSYGTHPSRSNWKTTSHVIESLQCTIDRLKRELQLQEARCDEAKNSKAALQKRCTQLESQEGALRHQYETLNSVLERKERRQRDNDRKLDDYKRMVDSLEKEQTVYIKEKMQREKSAKQNEAEIEKMKIEYTVMASEVKRKKDVYEAVMKKMVEVLKDMGIKEEEKKALDNLLNSTPSDFEVKTNGDSQQGQIQRVSTLSSKEKRTAKSQENSFKKSNSKSYEIMDGINVIASLEKLRERQLAEQQYIMSLHAEIQVERAKHVSAVSEMQMSHQKRLKELVDGHTKDMKQVLEKAQEESQQREQEMENKVQEVVELVKMVEQGHLKKVLAIKEREQAMKRVE